MRIHVDRVVVSGLAAAPDPGELHASIVRALTANLAGDATASEPTLVPNRRTAPATLRVEVRAGHDVGGALGTAIARAVTAK